MPQVIIPQAGQHGFIAPSDQIAQELPINAWTRVRNVRFRGGNAERFAGHAAVFATPSATPYFVVPYQAQEKRFWIHCSTAAVYSDDGTTRNNITGAAPTGTANDRWTAGVLGGVLLLNNGVNTPWYWGGSGALASIPGWDASWKCRSIGAFKSFAVAVGITKGSTKYPHMVKWSDAADPGTVPGSWDETDATKSAGEQDLAETTDQIVDQLVLGDANLIYKERSIYAMRFIGGTQVFEFRRLPGNYGMLAMGCAASTPKGHVVLANGDVVLVDGVNEPQSIINDRLREWLFKSQLNSLAYEKCFVASNPSKSEVWICYPESGETTCTQALVWNWETNTFGLRDLPNVTHAANGLLDYSQNNTWDPDSQAWNLDATTWDQLELTRADTHLLMASTAPGLYFADVGSDFLSAGVPAVLERTGMSLDSPDTVKLIRSVMPRVDAPAGTVLQISAGGAMDPETGPLWSAPVPYTVGQSYKADLFASGRFLALRITSSDGARWRIKSLSLDVEPMGLY